MRVSTRLQKGRGSEEPHSSSNLVSMTLGQLRKYYSSHKKGEAPKGLHSE